MEEETQAILFCSDLFHQEGDLEPLTNADVVGLSRQTLLAGLNPFLLSVMHGSAFVGNEAQALHDLAVVMKEVLAP